MADVERRCRIVNRLGLHARAAAKLVQAANKFSAEVTLVKDGSPANAKSIMGVLMLAAAQGSDLTLQASGPDAAAAVATIEALIVDGFGEDKG
jgi:phosphocarrier protein HPr